MSDPKTLYQTVILEHGNAPRNVGTLEDATHEHTAKNPLCGDRITVRLRIEGDVVRAARFDARGCMLVKASASLMTSQLEGRSVADARGSAAVVAALMGPTPPADAADLEPLRGAREFPARRSCVELPWQALQAALNSK